MLPHHLKHSEFDVPSKSIGHHCYVESARGSFIKLQSGSHFLPLTWLFANFFSLDFYRAVYVYIYTTDLNRMYKLINKEIKKTDR